MPHLADHTHCTGCTACANGCPKDAITMERDREGFAYPVIDGAACVRCGHCTAVRPVLPWERPLLHARCIRGLKRMTPSEETPPRAACSPCWRSISWKAAAWSLAPPLTEASICGTPPASARRTCGTCGRQVRPERSEGDVPEVRRWLDHDQVLFSGTPCQVDGLYRFWAAGRKTSPPATWCHGVPSPGVWRTWPGALRRASTRRLRRFRTTRSPDGRTAILPRSMATAPWIRAAVPPRNTAGPSDRRAVPAAQLLPLSLRLHDPGGRSDTGGFLGPAAG